MSVAACHPLMSTSRQNFYMYINSWNSGNHARDFRMMGFKPLLPEAMYAHIAELNRQFRAAIWPVSAAKTAYFRMQNKAFCNSLKDR